MQVPIGAQATVQLERTTSGGLRVSTPDAPGWATVARTPHQLFAAVQQAYSEAAVAEYARSRGEPYDVAAHDFAATALSVNGAQLPVDERQRETVIGELVTLPSTAPTASTAQQRRADPLSWQPLPDGRWKSPSGRTYRGDSQVVGRVRALREDMGIDTA